MSFRQADSAERRRRAVARRAFGRGDDTGVAMVVAIAVIMLATVAVGTLTAYALRENGSSGRERQRAVSIAIAEGSVDELIAQMDGASLGSVSASYCGPQAPYPETVAADEMTITSEITYYDSAGAPLPCTSAASATTAAVKATATSTALGGQAPAVRTFETVLRLSATQGSALTKAIFGQTGVAMNSPASELTTATGTYDGDVYAKSGNVVCQGTILGSITAAAGSVTFASGCERVAGEVHASGDIVSAANPMTVNSNLKSSGGSIALNELGSRSNQVFDGQAYARTTVTGDICPGTKCHGGQVLDPPDNPDFPQMSSSPGWAGYTVKDIPSGLCEVKKNDSNVDSLGWWFENVAPTTSQNTLIRMPDNCTAQFTGYSGTPIYLNANVAIFARGNVSPTSKLAFEFDSRPKFVGTTGSIKSLYFIQDYATPDCSKDGILVENHVTANTNVKALVYTPHNIRMTTGNLDIRGQVYAGCSVIADKPIDLVYDPLDFNGAVTNPGALSLHTEILSKRETTS